MELSVKPSTLAKNVKEIYQINNQEIPANTEIIDLGIIIDDKL